MQLSFHTLDVFTKHRFGGNPLAVVLGADALSTEQMQAITREFNLSETIFVMKPEDPANTAKVRIFFPGGEMAFAGHPTVGCAVLLANVVLITAVLSMFGATLTLPGIAGIVLTVGMAVDANVLIFERIREELRNGMSPHAAISAGYEKAFSAIADSNITTLIAGIVLFTFGTGPVRGFAVVLSLGIVTSMFTALIVSRALVYLLWDRKRKLDRLSIGMGY